MIIIILLVFYFRHLIKMRNSSGISIAVDAKMRITNSFQLSWLSHHTISTAYKRFQYENLMHFLWNTFSLHDDLCCEILSLSLFGEICCAILSFFLHDDLKANYCKILSLSLASLWFLQEQLQSNSMHYRLRRPIGFWKVQTVGQSRHLLLID